MGNGSRSAGTTFRQAWTIKLEGPLSRLLTSWLEPYRLESNAIRGRSIRGNSPADPQQQIQTPNETMLELAVRKVSTPRMSQKLRAAGFVVNNVISWVQMQCDSSAAECIVNAVSDEAVV